MKILIYTLFALISTSSFANSELDPFLRKVFKKLDLKPIIKTRDRTSAMYKLGSRLFMDNELSGNRNTSCLTCHHPLLGTGDELPLSIGEGGIGIGRSRELGNAVIIPRNAPHLYNLGFDEANLMFWDGRVSYNSQRNTFKTPAKGLNGKNPRLKSYTKVLTSALSAQAMFPPLSHDEMRGKKGTNEIADAVTDERAWKLLTQRVVSKDGYKNLILEAFTNVKSMSEINFAHIGEAIGYFQANEFLVNDTPFDRYLAGDNNAMNVSQKRGAKVFFGSARCFQCHSGINFNDGLFHNTGFPQIGPGKEENRNDKGLFYLTNDPEDLYAFKTPGLRNVSKTAPYGHSGSLRTLEQVVAHYGHPMRSNHHYNPGYRSLPYVLDLDVENMNDRLRRTDPIIGRMGIFINQEDQRDLVEFLRALSE